MLGTTQIVWTSDKPYVADLVCISLDPVVIKVSFVDYHGKFSVAHWTCESEEYPTTVHARYWCSRDSMGSIRYSNEEFADAMYGALDYFIALNEKLEEILLTE